MTNTTHNGEFPTGFVWGAGTSSYQIEGAVHKHGRGRCVWDAFCKKTGAIKNGDTGDVACDHVARYREDVALMKQIGLGAYRFSISWPRVMPEGVGAVSEPGLAFYDRLIDELLGAGIEPYVTLFHWDYPLELQHRGGWLNPASPDWFAEYAAPVVRRLSDRVSNWVTINEPQVFIGIGHGTGAHAPGLKLSMEEQIVITHHVNKAHGLAARTIREHARTRPQVGWAPVGIVAMPETESQADIAAARERMFAITKHDVWNNTWFSDPVVLGSYPQDGLSLFGQYLPGGWERELEIIRQPLDFFGVNIYQGEVVRQGTGGGAESVESVPGVPRSRFGWQITPEALYWGPRLLAERYELPVLITENGMSNTDWIALDGKVHDPQRIDFLARHLIEMRRAIRDGVPIKGYMHWSLMDNFEWAEGYEQRFGLTFIDYATRRRVLKDSAYWYADLIRSNGAALNADATPERSR